MSTTSLALCSHVMWNGIQSLREQHNFDEALLKLLIRREVVQEKDKDGFTVQAWTEDDRSNNFLFDDLK